MFEAISKERSMWADDEQIEVAEKDWKTGFLAEVKAAVLLRDSN